MVWGLLGCILLLLIILLICFIKLKSQKKKHDADMERFSKIVDLEAEELRLRNQLNEEEKSFRKNYLMMRRVPDKAFSKKLKGSVKHSTKSLTKKAPPLTRKKRQCRRLFLSMKQNWLL